MTTRKAYWEMAGLGATIEHHLIGPVWFYKRNTVQHWSQTLHESTIERGIRIWSVCIGWAKTEKQFLDGKEPAVVPGAYCR